MYYPVQSTKSKKIDHISINFHIYLHAYRGDKMGEGVVESVFARTCKTKKVLSVNTVIDIEIAKGKSGGY